MSRPRNRPSRVTTTSDGRDPTPNPHPKAKEKADREAKEAERAAKAKAQQAAGVTILHSASPSAPVDQETNGLLGIKGLRPEAGAPGEITRRAGVR